VWSIAQVVGTIKTHFRRNYDRSEIIADGVVHAIGVSLGLVGVVVLFLSVVRSGGGGEVTPVAVYAAGLLAALGLSAVYNLWPVSPMKWLLRRFDHSAIYVLIAATYTPFLAQLKTELAAMGLLIVVWLTAVIGSVIKLLLPGRFDRLAIALYLLLGWSGLVAYRPIAAALPGSILWLLAAGGAGEGFLVFLDGTTKKPLRQEKLPMHVHDFALSEAADTIYAVGHGKVLVLEMKG